jgi:hypothetical protein
LTTGTLLKKLSESFVPLLSLAIGTIDTFSRSDGSRDPETEVGQFPWAVMPY